MERKLRFPKDSAQIVISVFRKSPTGGGRIRAFDSEGNEVYDYPINDRDELLRELDKLLDDFKMK